MSLKVLMFGWEFPPYNSGGLGVACHGLTKALALQDDVEVTFVLPREIPINDEYMKFAFAGVETDKVKLRTLDTGLSAYMTSEQYRKSTHGSQYGPDLISEVLRYGELATKLAQEEDFDIIHAHDWLSFPAGIAAKKVSGKPLVLHVHATELDRTGRNGGHPDVMAIEKQGLQMADCILAVSQYTKDIIVSDYGIDVNKIEVLHNGIDSEEIVHELESHPEAVLDGLDKIKDSGQKLVLFIGRFTVQKGADKFILAAKRVLEYQPNTLFLMVGGGDMETDLIELAAKLGISDKMVFTGFLRGYKRTRVYEASDLFVMPSVSEPFGLVALESLLHDTPVILSKQSGVTEVIKHALTVDFWDVDNLVNLMVSALKHDTLHKELKNNGKREAFQATWKKAAARCKEIYEQTLRDKVLSMKH